MALGTIASSRPGPPDLRGGLGRTVWMAAALRPARTGRTIAMTKTVGSDCCPSRRPSSSSSPPATGSAAASVAPYRHADRGAHGEADAPPDPEADAFPDVRPRARGGRRGRDRLRLRAGREPEHRRDERVDRPQPDGSRPSTETFSGREVTRATTMVGTLMVLESRASPCRTGRVRRVAPGSASARAGRSPHGRSWAGGSRSSTADKGTIAMFVLDDNMVAVIGRPRRRTRSPS